jgi:hypothetical protein
LCCFQAEANGASGVDGEDDEDGGGIRGEPTAEEIDR